MIKIRLHVRATVSKGVIVSDVVLGESRRTYLR